MGKQDSPERKDDNPGSKQTNSRRKRVLVENKPTFKPKDIKLKVEPRVIISKECRLLAEKSLRKGSVERKPVITSRILRHEKSHLSDISLNLEEDKNKSLNKTAAILKKEKKDLSDNTVYTKEVVSKASASPPPPPPPRTPRTKSKFNFSTKVTQIVNQVSKEAPVSSKIRDKAVTRALTRLRKQPPSYLPQRVSILTLKSIPTELSTKTQITLTKRKAKAKPIEAPKPRKSKRYLTSTTPKAEKMDDSISKEKETISNIDALFKLEESLSSNNENDDSDSDDVEMQVLEKQVLSDTEESGEGNESHESSSLNFTINDDDESTLLSPSALPASALFRSPSKKKKVAVHDTIPEPIILPPTSYSIQTPGSPLATSSIPSSSCNFTPFFSTSTTITSVHSQSPEKRGRGRPRKALEDVKSVSGKLYRRKLAEKLATGVGRGKSVYLSDLHPAAAVSVPSRRFDQPEREPFDDSFDDQPTTTTTYTTLSQEDQTLGSRLQRWRNKSTFIYAKHKFRSNKDNGNDKLRDKFMCKVCKVGFTALSSLKRHYGTIYHKQQEQAGKNGVDFIGASTSFSEQIIDPSNFSTMENDRFFSSPSPSLCGSQNGVGQRSSSQPKTRTSSVVRRTAVDNIKKYYAAADAARRRREGVDGAPSTWLQKQQRRRKPLVHSDYVYQSSSLSAPISMGDDGWVDDDDEMGLVKEEDTENSYPLNEIDDDPDLTKVNEDPWLSNSWKGVGAPHFTCEVCNQSFTNKREFTRHLFKHREEEEQTESAKALTCPDCHLCMPNEPALLNHFRLLEHGDGHVIGEKKFTCKICNSVLPRADYYKKHMEFHKRPPIKCPHCPKKFMYKFYLQDHIKASHEWTNLNGNANGSTFGVHSGGMSAPGLGLGAVPIGSPKPKIELCFPNSPLVSTDNRRRTNTVGIPNNSTSYSKKSNLKTSGTKSVSGVTSSLLTSIELKEPSNLSSDMAKETGHFLSKFVDSRGAESDAEASLFHYMEQSTKRDGNLALHLKPMFDPRLGKTERRDDGFPMTLESTFENFGDNVANVGRNLDWKMRGKGNEDRQRVDSVLDQKKSVKIEISDKVETFQSQNAIGGVNNLSNNLSLIGCGSKGNLVEKPLESPLVCQDCGKQFEHRKSLVKHVRYYNQSEDFHCVLCSKSFKLKHHVSRHMKSFHNVDTSSTSGAEDMTEMEFLGSPSGSSSGGIATLTEKEPTILTSFEGKIDDQSYLSKKMPPTLTAKPSPSKIRKRLESSPAVPFSSSSSSVSTSKSLRKKASSVTSDPGGSSVSFSNELSSATAVVASDGISVFKCLLCKKLYPSKHQLNNHMWYHKKRSSTLHKCTECSAEFKLKSDLIAHQQQGHSSSSDSCAGVKKNTCSKCPAAHFANRKDLLRHMRETHNYLGRKLSLSSDKNEEEVKTKEKHRSASRCPICPLAFPRESDLSLHMTKEHLKCIACQECGLVLASKDLLREHIQQEHSQDDDDDDDEEDEEDEDTDDKVYSELPPKISPHTSPFQMPSLGLPTDDDDIEEEEEEDMQTQKNAESDFELLEIN